MLVSDVVHQQLPGTKSTDSDCHPPEQRKCDDNVKVLDLGFGELKDTGPLVSVRLKPTPFELSVLAGDRTTEEGAKLKIGTPDISAIRQTRSCMGKTYRLLEPRAMLREMVLNAILQSLVLVRTSLNILRESRGAEPEDKRLEMC